VASPRRHRLGAALLCGLLPAPVAVAENARSQRPALHRALDDFEKALDERWSYRHANGADFDAAIRALRKRVDAGLSTDETGLELQRIIALGIDGHAGVSGYTLPGKGYLPFLVEPEGQGFVAFNAERTSFLADGLPYLLRIDGRDVADWCTAAAALAPKGSPQYVRRRCAARMANLDLLRGLLGLPRNDTVEVTVGGPQDGTGQRTLRLPVAAAAPRLGTWPRGGSRLLDGNIGYLRLPTMVRSTSVPEIRRWMLAFRDTMGLVVDVRDNNGGERDALRLLFSYLAGPGDPPRVVNVAAYRLHAFHPDDHLAANHSLYRADSPVWNDAERGAIAAFAATFKPEWQPPPGQFSAWHYLVLRRVDDPDVYHYDKRVIVLMNDRCFSATDIFLAALKGMRNVTLLGTASAGGSAYTQEVALGPTPLRLNIGSMASFQRDGTLFDGHGVLPDVVVAPAPEYSIGGADAPLLEALKRLR
jgi:hypothetical protein